MPVVSGWGNPHPAAVCIHASCINVALGGTSLVAYDWHSILAGLFTWVWTRISTRLSSSLLGSIETPGSLWQPSNKYIQKQNFKNFSLHISLVVAVLLRWRLVYWHHLTLTLGQSVCSFCIHFFPQNLQESSMSDKYAWICWSKPLLMYMTLIVTDILDLQFLWIMTRHTAFWGGSSEQIHFLKKLNREIWKESVVRKPATTRKLGRFLRIMRKR